MFFESLYQATLHRITDDSNLQEISHFGKACVPKISSVSTCTLQKIKHSSMIHLAYTKNLNYTSSLYKLCFNKYTFTYNLTVSLDIKSLLGTGGVR